MHVSITWTNEVQDQNETDAKYSSADLTGNVVSWLNESAYLETRNMEHSEKILNDLCEPQKPFFAVIPMYQPMWDMKANCDKLNGRMPKIDNSPSLRQELGRLIPPKSKCKLQISYIRYGKKWVPNLVLLLMLLSLVLERMDWWEGGRHLSQHLHRGEDARRTME